MVMGFEAVARALGLRVFERGWLSSNNILFDAPQAPATLVDTGYATHATQTVALVRTALGARALDHVVNTHLHSDHCGGNAALAAAFPALRIHVPQTLVGTVQRWDEQALTFERTGQHCDRFAVHGALEPGALVQLGAHDWQIHAAPGHDPTAVMLFEPTQRVLIAGDALWEKRLAIVFPELEGQDGFNDNARVLNTIESLKPRWVIPGHGSPFADVAAALTASRARLAAFAAEPASHTRHAQRALLMFHMLEHQRRPKQAVIDWLVTAPILANTSLLTQAQGAALIEGLVQQGALVAQGADVAVPGLAGDKLSSKTLRSP
jgi:glyoxylase-like metal-dependent hydrolase (beta-lactamase superfamily II)